MKTLKEWRELRGLTQQELATACDVSISKVATTESGRGGPTSARIKRKFCRGLKIKPEELEV